MNQLNQDIYCAKLDSNTRWIDTDLALGGMVGLVEDEESCEEGEWAKRLGPVEIARLQFAAEHPDLADPLIATLPERKFSLKGEGALRQQMKAELQKKNAERQAASAKAGQLCLALWT